MAQKSKAYRAAAEKLEPGGLLQQFGGRRLLRDE